MQFPLCLEKSEKSVGSPVLTGWRYLGGSLSGIAALLPGSQQGELEARRGCEEIGAWLEGRGSPASRCAPLF